MVKKYACEPLCPLWLMLVTLPFSAIREFRNVQATALTDDKKRFPCEPLCSLWLMLVTLPFSAIREFRNIHARRSPHGKEVRL